MPAADQAMTRSLREEVGRRGCSPPLCLSIKEIKEIICFRGIETTNQMCLMKISKGAEKERERESVCVRDELYVLSHGRCVMLVDLSDLVAYPANYL